MCSLNIDTSMHGCNSLKRERDNFEVDQLHSAVLTNARLVAAAIAGCGKGGNWLIHATLSSQTNLVARCLINLTPRCVRSERFASLASIARFAPHDSTRWPCDCYHGRFVLFFCLPFPFSCDYRYNRQKSPSYKIARQNNDDNNDEVCYVEILHILCRP